ncbi:hypothetical protein UJ101_00389 [Flavobacteriaceae bacterium UJ101]|nr:hypothetical protein UJ101_00389 [Flavobacteriaceae bacterium UJ101]
MSCYVYILYSKTLDRYYIGQTQNLEERIKRHNSKHKGFTGKTNDWVILYREVFANQREAIKREKEIKNKKSRKYIEYLLSEK